MSPVWRESGYDDLVDGILGNGGQNLYVSKKGILQRIHHFDFNLDGYVDLLFCNSHDMNERVPVHVYQDLLGTRVLTELPSNGAYIGLLADLNKDGYDDLVIANQHNGTHSDLTAYIYYGSPEGLSEKYRIELPAPNCTAVAAGDFNGDGKIDLALCCNGKLRLYFQNDHGFMPSNYIDLDIPVLGMDAEDIDGDGFSDLYVRSADSAPRVYWGGHDGILLSRFTDVGSKEKNNREFSGTTPGWLPSSEGWRPKIIRLSGKILLFRRERNRACYYYFDNIRNYECVLRLDCPNAINTITGDLTGNGVQDLVVLCGDGPKERVDSWIFWGSLRGFLDSNRTAIKTLNARDAVVADIDCNGVSELIICQGRTDISNTTSSLVFRCDLDHSISELLKLPTHDATAVLAGKVSDSDLPSVIFVNHTGGNVRGDVNARVYYGSEQGFSPENHVDLPVWAATDAKCCDFNDNGWPDLFICNCSENAPNLDPGSFLYHGGPSGFNPKAKTVFPTIRAHGAGVGDFRHSGYLDIILAGFYNPELLIFKGGPNGFDFENPQRILLDDTLADDFRPGKEVSVKRSGKAGEYWEPRFIFVADFNNDGWLDVFISQCCGPRSLILWGGPDGFSIDQCQWLATEGTICAQAADLTGNGWLDLIIGGHQCPSKSCRYESYIYIYWGGPDGYKENRRMQLPAKACNSLAIADFNNDGILDIFATSYNSGRDRDCDSFIYWGSPDGKFSIERFSRLFTHSACGCVAADFNNDGFVDLAVANHKSYGDHITQSEVWWNGPDGFSKQNTTKLPTIGPHGMINVPVGNVLDRGPEEYYTSKPFKIPKGSRVKTIKWQAKCSPGTWVKGRIRSAETMELLPKAKWHGPSKNCCWFENNQQADAEIVWRPWIQYQLALGAKNSCGSPKISEIEIIYE